MQIHALTVQRLACSGFDTNWRGINSHHLHTVKSRLHQILYSHFPSPDFRTTLNSLCTAENEYVKQHRGLSSHNEQAICQTDLTNNQMTDTNNQIKNQLHKLCYQIQAKIPPQYPSFTPLKNKTDTNCWSTFHEWTWLKWVLL